MPGGRASGMAIPATRRTGPSYASQPGERVLFDVAPAGVPVGVAALGAEAQQTGLGVVQRPVAAAAHDAGRRKPLHRIG